MIEVFSAIANCRLDIDSVKSSYSEFPEFAPHIGEDYLNNIEKILVVGEVFSTKNSVSDRGADESYCTYALKNKKNPTCLKIQETLLNYDKNLSEKSIAFCFFIHKKEIKIGSYISNFSPKDLDDAMNSLMPLIDLLKPQKIIFLGNQTKRTIERRSDIKVFNGKSFKQYLVDSAIKTDIVSLKESSSYRTKKNEENDRAEKDDEDTLKFTFDLLNKLLHHAIKLFFKENGNVEKFLNDESAKEETKNFTTSLIKEIRIAFKNEQCCKKFEIAMKTYLDAVKRNIAEYESDIRDALEFISEQVGSIERCINHCGEIVDYNVDTIEDEKKAFLVTTMTKGLNKLLQKERDFLQRLLVPIKAIKNNSVDCTDNSNSLMARKIEFVKTLVKELRPKNDSDPGQVMSLQMVARKLNECNPPITTALGKKYDNNGKGVIVLLRNVYNVLESSSYQDERDIAADMLHSFAKRPVAKVFIRNEEYVSEGEYWKPFKNDSNEKHL